jgi:small subunit ribosomal protein S19
MTRSKWKGPYLSRFLLTDKLKKKRDTKIWNRNNSIPFFLLDKGVFVYNGKNFKKIFITRSMIGDKFGNYSFTRVFTRKEKDKKKKK